MSETPRTITSTSEVSGVVNRAVTKDLLGASVLVSGVVSREVSKSVLSASNVVTGTCIRYRYKEVTANVKVSSSISETNDSTFEYSNLGMKDFMYERLPQLYRSVDERNNFALKQFMNAVYLEGIDYCASEIHNLFNLKDPALCPSEYLTYLFGNMGLIYSGVIENLYQRNFMSHLIELIRRKGTVSCIEFLIRNITTMEVSYVRNSQYVYTFYIEAYENDAVLVASTTAIEVYILYFLPVGVTINIASLILDTETVALNIIEDLADDYVAYQGDVSLEFEDNTGLTVNELQEDWFYTNAYDCYDLTTVAAVETLTWN